ncbi:MAG TPA: hypothetical protein VGO98_01640 [Candidatus Saccharimonadales bacterium]|nr:hypothetical protein [Candidatus Saccharimonadales bacterium]
MPKKYRIYALLGAVLVIGGIGIVIYSATHRKPNPATPASASSAAKPEASQKIESIVTNPSTSPPQQSSQSTPPEPATPYPLHENITATVFWVGEGADNSNDFIHNRASAWMSDWTTSYGGVDDPENRCGYRPCAFTPKENPFYFALPFNDYDKNGLKPAAVLRAIPWYTGTIPEGTSIIKNRWIEVTHGNRVAYAQWEDVGPFGEDDAGYVFGTSKPTESRAGLDLSPALAEYLGVNGRGVVSWRFVDSGSVPKGEWTKIVTKSQLKYE